MDRGLATRGPARRRRPAALVVALGLCAVAGTVVQAVMAPLLPSIATSLGVDKAAATWLLTITLIAGAVLTPVLTRLGDLVGRRRILIVAMLGLLAGSVVCALFPDRFWGMLVGRALHGVGLGVVPLGISIIATQLGDRARVVGMAAISGAVGGGEAIALPLGGLLLEHAGLAAVFIACGGVALLGVVGVLVTVPAAGDDVAGGRLDLLGAGLLSAALTATLLGLTQGVAWGWTDGAVIALLVVAMVSGVAFWRRSGRHREPLLDLRLLRAREIALTNAAALLVGFAFFAAFVAAPAYVQTDPAAGYGFGVSASTAGIMLLPTGMVILLSAPLTGRLLVGAGPARTLAIGCSLIAVSYAALAALSNSVFQVGAAMTVGALGGGMAYAALPSLLTAHTPDRRAAEVNGVNVVIRTIGGAIASAALAMLLQLWTSSRDSGQPAEAAYRWYYVIGAIAATGAAALTTRMRDRARPTRRRGRARQLESQRSTPGI